MKKISMLITIILVLSLAGCSGNSSPGTLSEPPLNTTEPSPAPPPASTPDPAPSELKTPEEPGEDGPIPTVNIQVGNINFTAIMVDNESARTIVGEMPFTLKMDDYASQEKVTALTFDLPTARTETPAKINAGDISLWSGNNLVLFYTTFSNSYSYVPVGTIEDVTGLLAALGSGSAEVTFSVQ